MPVSRFRTASSWMATNLPSTFRRAVIRPTFTLTLGKLPTG